MTFAGWFHKASENGKCLPVMRNLARLWNMIAVALPASISYNGPTNLAEGHLMSEGNFTLDKFYQSWREYQDTLKQAIAPLTPEQLALRAAPDLRSVGEIVAHMISSRVHWFGDFLGERGSMPGVESLLAWDRRNPSLRTAGELVEGLDTSWRFIADLLNRWDSSDMQHTFPFESGGYHYDNSRSWVTCHILEHDLHHGGEISITLGMHGLQAPDV
jgi:uncharacterized damage-inducible protein DinB